MKKLKGIKIGFYLLNKIFSGKKAWSIHKLKILSQEQPKILAGDWSNLFWLFPLTFFLTYYISIRYEGKYLFYELSSELSHE